MDYFLELFLGGLTRGSIYALIALGYTMVYGIIELINFAHGEIYMIGAFAAYSISTLFGGGSLGFWLALIFAPLVVALISLVAERTLFCQWHTGERAELWRNAAVLDFVGWLRERNDRVGDEAAAHHVGQALDVGERRRAHVHAVGGG